jgi:outer membrane protein assembly factor BamB
MPDGSLMLSLRGFYRFIDLAGNTLYELKGGSSVGGPLHHDVVPLPNGNYLTFSTEQETYDVPALGGSSLVTGDRILEMSPPSQIAWSWSAFEHMDAQRFPSSLSQKEHPKHGDYDWTHANGMQYFEDDDSVIVSFRHQHWVTKINRGTGEVVWKLGNEGDFTLLSGDWFYGQHAPEMYPDGRLLVFDNGNDHPNGPPYTSRGVMYQLDLDAMTAEEIWSYQMPDYGSFLGDIDLLENGHVLITGGGVRIPGQPPQTGDSRIHEVTGDDDPQLVWELRAIEGTLYRATRVDSFWP